MEFNLIFRSQLVNNVFYYRTEVKTYIHIYTYGGGGVLVNGCVVDGVFKTGLFIYQHMFTFCMTEGKTLT